MVAAENGVLPGGKVGGMADVIAQMPPALEALGHTVDVLIPSYGRYHKQTDAIHRGTVSSQFGGVEQRLDLYQLDSTRSGVGQWVLHHPLFGQPPGQIYHHDDSSAPFATDANLYALFCAGVAASVELQFWSGLDVLHLHDWHTAGVLLFLTGDRSRVCPRTVFTIHNLALQGQRPLAGPQSSFQAWFGERPCPADGIDPRFPDCYNPMRLGINLADRVHVVSSGYALEILQPNGPFHHGGEGLEADLQRAATANRLHGILNGCEYPELLPEKRSRGSILNLISATLNRWVANQEMVSSAHFFALRNLVSLQSEKRKARPMLLTCVGRLVEQKVGLLRHPLPGDGRSVLEYLLEIVHKSAVLVVLGTGDAQCERFMIELAGRCTNLLYLRGFDEELADALYASGDLFLMPSTYEPCGISQMLAMRGGQPCLVHATGGLADTVEDDVNGFSFGGSTADEAAQDLVARFQQVVTLFENDTDPWNRIRDSAAAARFEWETSANGYVDLLYRQGQQGAQACGVV